MISLYSSAQREKCWTPNKNHPARDSGKIAHSAAGGQLIAAPQTMYDVLSSSSRYGIDQSSPQRPTERLTEDGKFSLPPSVRRKDRIPIIFPPASDGKTGPTASDGKDRVLRGSPS